MTNKDLIKQYVNTGMKLPKYQVGKLSNNDFKSYIRLRLINLNNVGHNPIEGYEYARMDDEMRNYLVKHYSTEKLYDAIFLNRYSDSDDFIWRLIELRPLNDIKEYFNQILRESHSRSTVIGTLIEKFGYIFNTKSEMAQMIRMFDTDELKYNFCVKYLKGLSKSLGNEKMTSKNSPIAAMVYYLNDDYVTSVAKHFISYNLKKNDGKILDDETFFDIMEGTSDANFNDIANFMTRTLDLMTNQIQFIQDEQKYMR